MKKKIKKETGICLDCGKNTYKLNEYYMVTDSTWLQANPKGDGMLCIGCLGKRLNRKLTCRDFFMCPLNVHNYFHGSKRLRNVMEAADYKLIYD